MKYLKLFENFGSNYPNIIMDSDGNDFISQVVTFKISDKLKSWFEDGIWIKKFQTEEFKEEGKDLSDSDYHDIGHQRVKKIGEVEYFTEDISIYFGTPIRDGKLGSRIEFDSFLTTDYFLKKNKSFFPTFKIYGEKYEYHRDKLNSIFAGPKSHARGNRGLIYGLYETTLDPNQIEEYFFVGGLKPGMRGESANFLVGHATLEKNRDDNYLLSYYMCVEVNFMRGFDNSWEIVPYVIMVKETSSPEQIRFDDMHTTAMKYKFEDPEIISVNYFTGHAKISFDKIINGLKPGDSDSYGLLVTKSVENIDDKDYPQYRART